MKLIKLLSLSALLAIFSACNTDDAEVKNILIIHGQEYKIERALYANYGQESPNMYRLDMDTVEFGSKDSPDSIHGYGDFEWDGNDITIDVTKHDPLYASGFNWNQGGYYDAGHFKSGTQTIKNGKDGIIILIIDCVDSAGERFYLNVGAQNEATYQWD